STNRVTARKGTSASGCSRRSGDSFAFSRSRSTGAPTRSKKEVAILSPATRTSGIATLTALDGKIWQRRQARRDAPRNAPPQIAKVRAMKIALLGVLPDATGALAQNGENPADAAAMEGSVDISRRPPWPIFEYSWDSAPRRRS